MMPSAAEEAALIELVRDVAAAEIMPRFRALDPAEIRTKTAADDLVTTADTEAEAALTAGIARILPDARVVGEEAVAADGALLDILGTPGRSVIVDPVDGTWNFANGLAVFGVILAVVDHGETVFGLLYDPVFDDWVAARKDGGAWQGRPGAADVPLTLGGGGALAEANGFVPLYLYHPEERGRIAEAMLRTGRTGSLRCSCQEYRQVLRGAADFNLNAQLMPWDHAAGALAVTEAGGRAALAEGTAYHPALRSGRLIAARSDDLWREVRDTFTPR